MRASRRLLIPVAALVLAAGCFEVPVQERLEISFGDGPGAVVRCEVAFAEGPHPTAVRERLATVRREYLDLLDPWTRRFERLEAKQEAYGWERSQGELVRVTRRARIVPDRLSDLLYDTSINVSYFERDGVAELAMYAGESQRATREQEVAYREALDRFSKDVTSYFRAMDEVYRYLDAHPDREVAVFAALVAEEGDWDEPTAEEEKLLDDVSAATDRVLAILATDSNRAFSFEEISSLVNDPFPADVVIVPGGQLLEVDGFVPDEASGGLRVPRVSLWAAFESLRGRWLSPDPLVLLVESAQDETAEALSPETLAAEARVSRPPSSWTNVREELSVRLKTATTYRARWIVRRGETDSR